MAKRKPTVESVLKDRNLQRKLVRKLQALSYMSSSDISCGYKQFYAVGDNIRSLRIIVREACADRIGKQVLVSNDQMAKPIYKALLSYIRTGEYHDRTAVGWMDHNDDHHTLGGAVLFSDAVGGECDKFGQWAVERGAAKFLHSCHNPNTSHEINLYAITTTKGEEPK